MVRNGYVKDYLKHKNECSFINYSGMADESNLMQDAGHTADLIAVQVLWSQYTDSSCFAVAG